MTSTRSHASFGAPLTERELDIVRLVVQGDANEPIAQRLHLGESTVKTHLKRIMAKTGARNRAHLAAVVVAQGIADPMMNSLFIRDHNRVGPS